MSDGRWSAAARKIAGRWRLTAPIAAALVVAVVVTLVVTRNGDEPFVLRDKDLASLRALPDPVPPGAAGTELTCTVSKKTLNEVLPNANKVRFAEGCRWVAGDDYSHLVSAYIRGDRDEGPPFETEPGFATSGDHPKVISGVGDEAVAAYDGNTAQVAVRVNGLAIQVDLDGWRYWRTHEEKIRDAVKIAKELVAAQKMPVRPVPAGTASGYTTIPEACDLVPGKVADELVGKDHDSGAYAKPLLSGYISAFPAVLSGVNAAKTDTCIWTPRSDPADLDLRVTTGLAADWKPGIGVRAATGRYLDLHRAARDGDNPVEPPQRPFQVLAGLAEQAFGSVMLHQNRGPVGRVVFRFRNVLVEVWYGKLDEIDTGDGRSYTDVPRERLLKVAYTAAVQAAKKLQA